MQSRSENQNFLAPSPSNPHTGGNNVESQLGAISVLSSSCDHPLTSKLCTNILIS